MSKCPSRSEGRSHAAGLQVRFAHLPPLRRGSDPSRWGAWRLWSKFSFVVELFIGFSEISRQLRNRHSPRSVARRRKRRRWSRGWVGRLPTSSRRSLLPYTEQSNESREPDAFPGLSALGVGLAAQLPQLRCACIRSSWTCPNVTGAWGHICVNGSGMSRRRCMLWCWPSPFSSPRFQWSPPVRPSRALPRQSGMGTVRYGAPRVAASIAAASPCLQIRWFAQAQSSQSVIIWWKPTSGVVAEGLGSRIIDHLHHHVSIRIWNRGLVGSLRLTSRGPSSPCPPLGPPAREAEVQPYCEWYGTPDIYIIAALQLAHRTDS